MNDKVREIVLNTVYLLYKGKGMMTHPNPRVNAILITNHIEYSTKKGEQRPNLNEVKVAAYELYQSGHLKEHRTKNEEPSYSITGKGIISIEGESKFLKEEKNSEAVNIENINISDIHAPIAIGKNITININQVYNELHQHLETLSEAIQDADIDEAVKKDSLAEIITIDTQLSKREPNKNIIKEAWNVLEKLAAVGTLLGLIEKIKPLIANMLS